jgi:hypothetical protein
MQQNVPQPATPPVPVQQIPVALTPEQLRDVSGAGMQTAALPGGRW